MKKQMGFTLVEIMIVVAIIGLLAAIAIPSFLKARQQSQRNGCINNLRQIDAAKEQAALEFRWTNGMTCRVGTDAWISNVNLYIKGLTANSTNTPTCPGGGSYNYQPIGVNPSCALSAEGHVQAAP